MPRADTVAGLGATNAPTLDADAVMVGHRRPPRQRDPLRDPAPEIVRLDAERIAKPHERAIVHFVAGEPGAVLEALAAPAVHNAATIAFAADKLRRALLRASDGVFEHVEPQTPLRGIGTVRALVELDRQHDVIGENSIGAT